MSKVRGACTGMVGCRPDAGCHALKRTAATASPDVPVAVIGRRLPLQVIRWRPGTSPVAGADLYAPAFGEQSAGKIVNVAAASDGGFEALAVLQSSSLEAGEIHLGAVDGPRLTVLELP